MIKEINVCSTSNNWYVEHLYVTMYSLLFNLEKKINCNIYILDSDLTDKNHLFLKRLEKIFLNSKIIFINVDESKYKKYPDCLWTRQTYFKLDIPRFIPDKDKILFLDPDIIVNWDISNLFEIDMKNYALCAVPEWPRAIRYVKDFWLPFSYQPINAWVMLLNCKTLREKGYIDKFFEFLDENISKIKLYDQDVFNCVLFKHIKYLSPKYNSLNVPLYMCWSWYNPIITHFAWWKDSKPWKAENCAHPFKDRYYLYRKFAWLPSVVFPKNTKKESWFIVLRIIMFLRIFRFKKMYR